MEMFKELRKGDRVRYEDVYVHDKLRITGEGEIEGFGRFDCTDIVWVKKENGGVAGIPREKVIKI